MGVVFVDVGQGNKAPPAFVNIGVFYEAVPVTVRAFRVTVSAAVFAVSAVFVEVHRVCSRMAEYAVKNNSYAVFLGSSAQLSEILLGAHNRVNSLIAGRIVAVIFVSLKNRVKINTAYTQSLQIRQFFLNAL